MPASLIVELIAFAIFAFCLFGAGLQLIIMIVRPPKREKVLEPSKRDQVSGSR